MMVSIITALFSSVHSPFGAGEVFLAFFSGALGGVSAVETGATRFFDIGEVVGLELITGLGSVLDDEEVGEESIAEYLNSK
jgi:hypothetical protein